MIWLGLASIGLIAKGRRENKKKTVLWLGGIFLFHGSLAVGLWVEAGGKAFRGSETGLIGWFIIGLGLFLICELLPIFQTHAAGWALAAAGLAVASFALGFDVFRPDDYSFLPGAILGAFVLIVAVQAYLRLASMKETSRAGRLMLAAYILAIAVLVYAATAKTIDRGWALPWAYLASAGALLFASGQVWTGWETLLKTKVTEPWLRVGAINMGQLLMVTAAFFVYREFL